MKSAYGIALDGFVLPYGDLAIGGCRKTPYVVVQNVGAYLDIPRFLDSEPINDASDAEAYLAGLQFSLRQLNGELGRLRAARAMRIVPPVFLLGAGLSAHTHGISASGGEERLTDSPLSAS